MLSASCTEAELDERVFRLPLQDDWQQQINDLLPQLEGADWFYLLRAGDRLVAPALLVMAERIAFSRTLTCLYSDEGGLRQGESAEPAFKPDFNLDLMRSYPYVGRALAFEREAFPGAGRFRFASSASWRLTMCSGAWSRMTALQVIGHIAEVLLESAFDLAKWLSQPEVVENNPLLLQAHLQRMGIAHEIRHGRFDAAQPCRLSP